jgi:hypothetical protein
MRVHVLASRTWLAPGTLGDMAMARRVLSLKKQPMAGAAIAEKGAARSNQSRKGADGASPLWAESSFLLLPVAARAFLTVSPRSSCPPSSHFTRFTSSARHMHLLTLPSPPSSVAQKCSCLSPPSPSPSPSPSPASSRLSKPTSAHPASPVNRLRLAPANAHARDRSLTTATGHLLAFHCTCPVWAAPSSLIRLANAPRASLPL